MSTPVSIPVQPNPYGFGWEENVDLDKFHRDIEWDLARARDGADAAPAYIPPWERNDWGGSDVVVTPPRNPGGYVPPTRAAIQPGQRDWVYMPTEKEQLRMRDENKRREALAVGKDWREARLPKREEEVTIQPVYGDWRESEIPTRKPTLRDELMSEMVW